MILGNFLGIDPGHDTPGLSQNNRLQEAVWRDFAANPSTLRQTADAIERACAFFEEGTLVVDELPDEEVFPEGQLLTRLHLIRERNKAVAERKREQVLTETGRLACEACDFDFARVYGVLGERFSECHHLAPLSELPGVRTTRLSDLASGLRRNCHRMLHRARPVLTILELRTVILNSAKCPA